MVSDAVHPCPRCELRFASSAEWRHHIDAEHSPRPDPPGTPTGQLVVAVDPARAPGPEVRVAAAFAAQAGQTLDLVAVPSAGLGAITVDSYLRARASEARQAGVATIAWSVLDQADPQGAILAHLSSAGGTMACLGTRARTPIRALLLGSVAEPVVRRSPVPVMLVGPRCTVPADGFLAVLACVDGSATSDAVRRVAVRIATLTSVPVEELHAVAAGPGHDLERLAGPPALAGEAAAEAILRRLGGDPATIAVLGTEGRCGVDGLVFASVALAVTREAHGPVVILPPGLCASPVTTESVVAED